MLLRFDPHRFKLRDGSFPVDDADVQGQVVEQVAILHLADGDSQFFRPLVIRPVTLQRRDSGMVKPLPEKQLEIAPGEFLHHTLEIFRQGVVIAKAKIIFLDHILKLLIPDLMPEHVQHPARLLVGVGAEDPGDGNRRVND